MSMPRPISALESESVSVACRGSGFGESLVALPARCPKTARDLILALFGPDQNPFEVFETGVGEVIASFHRAVLRRKAVEKRVTRVPAPDRGGRPPDRPAT